MKRSNGDRNSESDAALVRVQMDAKARNHRWRAYLCARRDELQSRLGYAHVPTHNSPAHNSYTDLQAVRKQRHTGYLSAEHLSSRVSGVEIASASAEPSALSAPVIDNAEASDQPEDPSFPEQDMHEPESSDDMYNNDFPDALTTSSSDMGIPQRKIPAIRSRR